MSTFKLNTSDTEFKDRQKKVFDQLQILENNRKNIDEDSTKGVKSSTHTHSRRATRSETKQFRGKESIFKKPQMPAPKNFINKIPDFKKNPHKWTKYSLEDVQELTDESNKKSAMDFLKELANRKKLDQQGKDCEDMEELPTKIVFNKHVKVSDSSIRDRTIDIADNPPSDKPSFTSSKLVMPEYVIGQKPVKKQKKLKKSTEKGKELKLDHLVFEDE